MSKLIRSAVLLSAMVAHSLWANDDVDFGPESHGLRCRAVAVSSATDDELPDLELKTNEFARGEDVTFAVQLKNVSNQPITLLGVRYGDSYATAKGRLNTHFIGPHLFDFEFTDAEGVPLPRAERFFVNDLLSLHGQSVHKVEPGESLTVLLRPAKFMAPMDYHLAAGHYRAKIRYRGSSEETNAEIAKHWPDNPAATTWTHDVTSNVVEFTIAGDPAAPLPPELIWGPEKDGLQAAIEFIKPHYITEDPQQPPGVPAKANLQVVFHVKNVSDKPITFVSETGRQGDTALVTDAHGNKVDTSTVFFSGWPIDVRWHLSPGEVATLNVLSPATRSISKPGEYKVAYEIRFNSRTSSDAEGNQTFPAKEDWQDVLTTGQTPLFLRERTIEDDDRAKPPNFVGKVKFVDDQGKAIASGSFSFRGRIKHKYHNNRLLKPGVITIPDCTTDPSTITVRADGFEEAVFHNVKLAADKTTVLKLKQAIPAKFRLMHSMDGSPIVDAEVRYFNKMPVKASAGPFPTDGLQGPVWGKSDADGRVTLDTLQQVNPYSEKLGEAQYYFYIAPKDDKIAPRFVGPIKAGQDLGDVKLGPFVEVHGEVHGTEEELDRFAAEWDQPFEQKSENADANWLYAVSKRLQTERVGDKLTFHLSGLRAGNLRIVSCFGPRPHSVSHSYQRRDPGENDVVVNVDLSKPSTDIVLTSTGLASAKPHAGEAKVDPDKFQPFDCVVVDAETNEPIQGKGLTVQFLFTWPPVADDPKATVGNVIWTNVKGDFKFVIPDKVMNHPKRDEILVVWALGHHQHYEDLKPVANITVGQILRDDPKSARDTFRRIKLKPKKRDIVKILNTKASLKADGESLFEVLSTLERIYDVPVTLSLLEMKAKGVTGSTSIRMEVSEVSLRVLFELVAAKAGLDCDITERGVRIPAKPVADNHPSK